MFALPKLILLSCLLTLLAACAATPIAQDFGIKTKLVTIASERGGMFYMLQLELTDEVPPNADVLIRYEQLDEPGNYKDLALGNLGEVRVLNFRSMKSTAVKQNYIYTLQLSLIDPQTHKQVAAYNALMKPNITTNVSELLDIKLL